MANIPTTTNFVAVIIFLLNCIAPIDATEVRAGRVAGLIKMSQISDDEVSYTSDNRDACSILLANLCPESIDTSMKFLLKCKTLACKLPVNDVLSHWPPATFVPVARLDERSPLEDWCSEACKRFADTNSSNVAAPIAPTPGVSVALFALVRSASGSVETLFERNRCLSHALEGGPAFDQIVVHDGGLSFEAQGAIVAHSPSTRFIDARAYGEFALPENISLPDEVISNAATLGYRHMVRAPLALCMCLRLCMLLC